MNCFVIMPFAPEFDDVYVAIKASVTNATLPNACRCFRLDESRPAGRITDRLLQEIRAASLCIADLTGNRPNVMWEVGFAMALGCPTILVTQSLADLPFDLRDMQSLEYDRSKLNSSLSQPLQRIVVDTLSIENRGRQATHDGKELVGELLTQIADLKSMMAQAVRSWNPPTTAKVDEPTRGCDLTGLEGAWHTGDGTHLYAKVVGNELVVPYCFQGDHELTGAYFNWRKTGPYWFARYSWLRLIAPPTGFTFLRQESVDIMRGAWWSDSSGFGEPLSPPARAGVPVVWERTMNNRFPRWAQQFLKDVQISGIEQGVQAAQKVARGHSSPALPL